MSWTVSSAGGRHLCLQTTQEWITSHGGLPADHPDLSVGFNSSSVAFFPPAVTFSSGDELALVFLQIHPLRPAASGTGSGSLMTHISSGGGGASCLGAPVPSSVLCCLRFFSLVWELIVSCSEFLVLWTEHRNSAQDINHYCRHQTSNDKRPQIHAGIFQLVE